MTTWLAATEVPGYLFPTTALVLSAAVVAYVSVRLHVVAIVGFLIAGVIIGPEQLGLVSDGEVVHAAADIGVILLLFTIGLEFSLEKLARVWRWIVLGGGAQVLLTIALTFVLVLIAGGDWRGGLFTGFVVALSSTAIVLTILADRGETNTVRGRLALAVLIFQDLAVVAMVVILPLLSPDATGGAGALAEALLTAAVVVTLVLVGARRLMPPLMHRIAAVCSPEVFLLAVLAICLTTAYLTALAGVSVSLGAFLAGLVVSESRQSTQALSEVLPLKTIFSAVFFVSVGMLLDVGYVADNMPLVLGLVAVVLAVKVIATTTSLLPTGVGWRQALAAGFLLAQIGEFSFVLLNTGEAAGLTPAALDEDGFQALVATTVILMVMTPLLSGIGDRILRGTNLFVTDPDAPDEASEAPLDGEWRDHVVLLGWGPDSLGVALDMQAQGVPAVITTLNPEGLTAAEHAGIAAVSGDSTRAPVLEHVRVGSARLVVVAEDQAEQCIQIVTMVRSLSDAPILVRPHGGVPLDELADAGASNVVDSALSARYLLAREVRDLLGIERPETPRPEYGGVTWVDPTRLTHVHVPMESGCNHAADTRPVLPSSEGCEECLRGGSDWVHLRQCLTCGHVGCCDSSPHRHSRAHFHESGHPLMMSVEPGDSWAFCFADGVTFSDKS